jgi:cytochrome P450
MKPATKRATTFPIFEQATRANPQAVYEQMRQSQPIYRAIGPLSGNTFWFFVDYDDVHAILKDTRFVKDARKNLPAPFAQRFAMPESSMYEAINRHLLNLDAPDHTRLRNLVHKAFTPRIIQNLVPRIEEIVNNLLDAMDGDKETDLIEAFAYPVPITVIAEMLGVEANMRDKFRFWTRALLFGMNEGESMQSVMEFVQYMNQLIEDRQKDPREDILSGLVHAEDNGETLDRMELLSMVFLLLVAGHETTVNLIGNGTLALLQHPDQLSLLRQKPHLINSAVEEMLRYNGPVETPTWRFARQDIEFGGHTIQTGDVVLPSLLAANRDPKIFENPNEFDITRTPNPHVAFGYGVHYCLGAPLARLEGTIAINALVQRFPRLALNTRPELLQWSGSLLIHGMTAMPVRLD